MKQFSKDLGNVALAPKGRWSREQEYERLALVYNAYNNLSYVAKTNVPIGVEIDNREYWQPMNATGYADNNFINLTVENENGTITAYESLEEAVATILPINRRSGATLSFYNLNSDRLDRQAEFELWQFNSTDLANWEIRDYWNNIYYNWNVFAGWYVGADNLKNHVKIPNVGQYAYVGTNLNDALLYQCRTNGTWTNTGIKVRNYISVVVSGNIIIGENGNWFSDGKDTGIPATPAVDEQLDNIVLQLQQHATEIDELQKQDVVLKSNIDSNFETINNKVDNIKTVTDNKIDTADANLQNQIISNDNDIATLNTKHESLSRTVQGIAATGGANTATNVTYNNDASGLNAENVQDAIDEVNSIATYDVSTRNGGVVFESLRALLGNYNLDTLIPVSFRHGGMTIRFIQGSAPSSDNKYVQYRLMATSFSTSESDWQGVDDEPTAGSDNIVKSGGVANKLIELEEDVEVIAEKNTTPPVVEGLAIKNSNLVKLDATKKTFYVQGKEGQSITIYFVDTTDTVSFYFGFADEMPVEGLPITYYKTSSPSDTLRNLVFPKDCYLLVTCSTTNSCYYIKEKTSGIGFDVYTLKQTILEAKEDVEFSVDDKGIWYEDTDKYNGGSEVVMGSLKTTPFISLNYVKSIVFKLRIFDRSTFAAVAYYDANRNYLGGLKGYDGSTEVIIQSSNFPQTSAYVRFSSENFDGCYAKLFYTCSMIDKIRTDIKDINVELDNYDNTFKYWAVCGDSITHANHKCMNPLAGDDVYNPIDDYQGRGYSAYQSGNYPNYAYLYCKKHHIKWANYGFGGTIIGSYVPIGETLLYPFVEDRITQFKEGINWNYISLFFGWNDRMHGVQYYREKWLYDNYGVAIKYTTESSKYGTSGYCTESQRIACDKATEVIDGVSYTGYNLFFMKFLGNINDTTTYTYYGAYNYAVGYLMRKFPKVKIMLITPYIGDVNRMYYQKMRQAIIDVAEKFGIIYFDLGSLPYWYFTNMNNTPFANPDRADGMWYKDSWIPEEPELRLCKPTIEGFHQHLYCYDSVHPTNLGYEMIAEPIGNKLING